MSTNRRQFLVLGGATLAGAAVLSACADSSVVKSSGTIAATSVPPTVPVAEPTAADKAEDVALLHTATSLERSIVAAYDALLAHDLLTEPGGRAWITTLQGHHTSYVTALGALTTASDGEAHTEPNAYVDDAIVKAKLDVAQTTEDLLALAVTLEQTAASTLALAVRSLHVKANRIGVMEIAAAESRNVALLKLVAQPGEPADALGDATVPLLDSLGNEAAVG